MRKLFVLIVFVFITLLAESQNLTVEGASPNMYITHTVAPKETFYSIGRLYNQAPKLIASFNKLVMEKGVAIGQHVKVPLNAQNFESSENVSSGDALIPLTHIIAKSETLFRISNDHNVSVAAVRKWNNLPSDKINPGSPLIVGYLKTSNAASVTSVIKNSESPAVNNAEPAQTKAAETEKQIAAPAGKAEKNTAFDPTGDSEKKKDQTLTQKEDKDAQRTKETPVADTKADTQKDTALAVATEQTPKPVNAGAATEKEQPVKQQETAVAKNESGKINQTPDISNISSGTAGTFEETYTLQSARKSVNSISGQAATFKSTSGWQDKKFYILINNIAAGTIVKISSAENKVVYAKVLGSMPEMKENAGLLLRISNAAASYLGIIDPKFSVQVSYFQ